MQATTTAFAISDLTGAAMSAVPSTLELLLEAEVSSVKANLPTARYQVPRLREAADPELGLRLL